MMSKYFQSRAVWITGAALLALGLAGACATSKRSEPPGSAASVSATTSPQPQADYAAAPAELERMGPTEDSAPEATPEAAPKAAHATGREQPVRSAKPSGGSRPAAAPARSPSAEFEAPATKKSKALDEGEARNDLLAGRDAADPLLPSTRDSSELRVALQDWQNAANQLSTSHGCDDGCRAFQSMQRAASRICNLVLNQDPAQRCATAKSRVQSAERDISQRCGKCER